MTTNDSQFNPRLTRRFEKLKQENRAGLITFVTAGDPDFATAMNILRGLPRAGADIIELGMPFSDPMADGPAVQMANLRSLGAGMTLQKTLNMVSEFRQEDEYTPIILMGYYNPIYHYGNQRFIDNAITAGVDGLIIVDLPTEEDDELCHPCLTAGLNWIRLITPTTNADRCTLILEHSSGFVYYVSIIGITGTRSADQVNVSRALALIRQRTNLPIAVGFGIKSAEQVAQTAADADAVVVGSAIVNKIADGLNNNYSNREIVDNVHRFVGELASGLINRP